MEFFCRRSDDLQGAGEINSPIEWRSKEAKGAWSYRGKNGKVGLRARYALPLSS